MSGKTKLYIFVFLVVVYILGKTGVLDSNSSASIPSKSAYEYEQNQKNREWISNYEKSHSTGASYSTKPSPSKPATNHSSKKYSSKTSMPDCDDYEDFDEFMDDWDGRMPDGSDAEDYWENW